MKSYFGPASGRRRDDCQYLVFRHHGDSYTPDRGHIDLVQALDQRLENTLVFSGMLSGIWVSPTGRPFIADVAQRVHYNPVHAPRAAPWQVLPVPCVVAGVWGLDDDHVFCWGQRRGEGALFGLEAGRFVEMPGPGSIVQMHGTRPDRIFAVGHEGLIARWNGETWQRETSPLAGTLTGVWVADDTVYACGSGIAIREGDRWRTVLERGRAAPLHQIARWRDRVWIAAGPAGLGELVDGALVIVKPNILAETLDARDELLIGAPTMVVGSSDGVRFVATRLEHVVTILERAT